MEQGSSATPGLYHGSLPTVAKAYLGPDPLYIRTITKGGGWVDDPDWLGNFTLAEPDDECWGTTGVRRGTGEPIQSLAVYFAAVDATGQQVAATATVRGFVINKPGVYDLKAGLKGIRHPSTDAIAGFDLSEPFVITCGKHSKMGVRLSSIVSATATEIRIAVQEIQ
jgi:hypothetical protein